MLADWQQLVGHQNLKQKIQMHAKVKEENNQLKKEKAAFEKIVAQQKKVIERITQAAGGNEQDKENCLLSKIDQEEQLQVSWRLQPTSC